MSHAVPVISLCHVRGRVRALPESTLRLISLSKVGTERRQRDSRSSLTKVMLKTFLIPITPLIWWSRCLEQCLRRARKRLRQSWFAYAGPADVSLWPTGFLRALLVRSLRQLPVVFLHRRGYRRHFYGETKPRCANACRTAHRKWCLHGASYPLGSRLPHPKWLSFGGSFMARHSERLLHSMLMDKLHFAKISKGFGPPTTKEMEAPLLLSRSTWRWWHSGHDHFNRLATLFLLGTLLTLCYS